MSRPGTPIAPSGATAAPSEPMPVVDATGAGPSTATGQAVAVRRPQGIAAISSLPDPFPPGMSTTVGRPGPPSGGWGRWPSRNELRDADMSAQPEVHARAPWFSEDDLLEMQGEITHWVDAVRTLPNGIPSDAVMTEDWRRRIALPDQALERGPNETVAQARVRLVRLVVERFEATVSGYEIFPRRWGVDTWTPRCNIEWDHCRELASIDTSTFPAGGPRVMQRAMLMYHPTLPQDFREQTRSGSAFWESIRVERSNRNRYGYLIPHQCREVAIVRRDAMPGRWPRVPMWFAEYEVPQGCLVELPPCVTYVGLWLNEHRDSPYWSVFVTEWCVLAAKNLLWDAYDRMYLWYVPAHVAEGIEYLAQAGALDAPLNGSANVDEAVELVRLSRSQRWDEVQRGNNHRTPPPCSMFSPGRTEPAGDFVFIDAATRTRISTAEARAIQARRAGQEPPPPPRYSAGSGGGRRSRRGRSRRRDPIEWKSDGWMTAVNQDAGQPSGADRERQAKIPRVEAEAGPSTTVLPRPGTPGATSPDRTRAARIASASAAASTQVDVGSAAGASGEATKQAEPTKSEPEVIDLTGDDDKVKSEPVEEGSASAPRATTSNMDAIIGIAAESMLNAGMDAAAVREALSRMRQGRRPAGGGEADKPEGS